MGGSRGEILAEKKTFQTSPTDSVGNITNSPIHHQQSKSSLHTSAIAIVLQV